MHGLQLGCISPPVSGKNFCPISGLLLIWIKCNGIWFWRSSRVESQAVLSHGACRWFGRGPRAGYWAPICLQHARLPAAGCWQQWQGEHSRQTCLCEPESCGTC